LDTCPYSYRQFGLAQQHAFLQKRDCDNFAV
jgi:hypothetical protein